MDRTELIRQEQLKETEAELRRIGCEKCNICGIFMDKDFINNGKCNEC